MTKKKTYIKLPCFKSISVSGYSLFEKDWNYRIKSGLNLFLGVNGVGKTTATNLLIYALIGYQKDLSNDYFKDRGDKKEDEADENVEEILPTVEIEFEIGDNKFRIKRCITEPIIFEFSINDDVFTKDEYDNIEETYEGYLLSESGFANLEDVAFVLRSFLIRVEEGNYLLWDDNGGAQSKLIRLLISDLGFEEEYAKISKEVKDTDTILRGTQDDRAQWQKRIDALKKEQEFSLKDNKQKKTKDQVEKEYSAITKRIEEVKNAHKGSVDHLTSLKDTTKRVNNQVETLGVEREQNAEQITALEEKYFKHIYSDHKILLAVNKLKFQQQCIYCSKKTTKEIADSIIKSVENCKCPVCQSKIEGGGEEQKIDSNTVAKLESLKEYLKNSKDKFESLLEEQKFCQVNFETTAKRERELATDLNVLAVTSYELQLALMALRQNPEENFTIYDNDIRALEKEVKKYDEEIEKARIVFNDVLEKLKTKVEEENKVITTFEKQLNAIFTKYTDAYFKKGCSLETIDLKPKDSKVKVKSYVPNFEGVLRWTDDRISTSQRIFLEYLFRFSLLELYNQISENKTSIILETSEGAFDITNTKKLAESFAKFSSKNHTLIAISNFNKLDFLRGLSDGMGSNKKNRILNFLEFSRLTETQQAEMERYKRILKRLQPA